MIIFGHLLFQKMAVELVAGLADRQSAAVLVEDLNLLVVKVVGAVVQLAGAVEVVALDTLERHATESDSRQATIHQVTAEGAQYLVVRVLPMLDGHHDVVIVQLGEAVEVKSGKWKVEGGNI